MLPIVNLVSEYALLQLKKVSFEKPYLTFGGKWINTKNKGNENI